MSNNLKFELGWWMPQSEIHFLRNMIQSNSTHKNRYTYQHYKLIAILNHIPKNRFKIAIDIGSHIGTWTYSLIDCFDFVHCFEPIKTHQDCWIKNLEGCNKVKLYPIALGDRDEVVKMQIPISCTGGAYIASIKNPAKSIQSNKHLIVNYDISVKCLDEFNFEDVDFIKIDTEGYELNVLKGAKETILRNKPYIFLEQKADNLHGVEFLEELGMGKIFSWYGDYLMGWRLLTKEEHTKSIRGMFGNSKMGIRIEGD